MMSSSVHSLSLGHSSGVTVIVIISPTVGGGTEVLKFLPMDLLRRSFVWGVDAITLSVYRVGILEVLRLRHLIVFQ